jgi:DNA polymerase
MKRIHIDFETRSIIDLRTLGSTIYAQHGSTSPLMLGVIADETEELIDFFDDDWYRALTYPTIPYDDYRIQNDQNHYFPEILQEAIKSDAVFVAHNARFEQDIWYWICHKRWNWPMPSRWSCTQARARYWGLRASLEHCAQDLQLTNQKLADGKSFINTFCTPRKWDGAKRDGKIAVHWAEPEDMPLEWDKGKRYCLQDARVEKAIDELLPDLPPFEQAVWDMDFKLNTHGLPIDVDSVAKAIHFSDHYTENAVRRFNAVTRVNPTQRDKVLAYLKTREDMEKLPNLQSKTLSTVLQNDIPSDLREVLNLRLDCSRASVKKLQAMLDNTSGDGYARGLFMYHGAHTGRWSGKRIQPHNFIRGEAKHADIMFKFLDSPVWQHGVNRYYNPKWVDDADLLFPRPLKSLSHSMRGFIKAPNNRYILSGDYSQIEARVLAWLANCTSLLRAYEAGEDVYVRFAGDHMYHRAYSSYFDLHGEVLTEFKNERQRAKSAVLGCGFQLGAPGFQAYCDAQDIVISLNEAMFTVNAYRDAYPEISDWNTGLWARTNYCAIQATLNENQIVALHGTPVTFHIYRIDSERWWLICSLPSGRHIAYFRPRADQFNSWGKPELTFSIDWHGRRQREYTYGGKLVENIVQGIARDICAIGAINAMAAGFDLAALIHDEIVSIHPSNSNDIKALLRKCMLSLPDSYAGLPLNAEVKAMRRYTK